MKTTVRANISKWRTWRRSELPEFLQEHSDNSPGKSQKNTDESPRALLTSDEVSIHDSTHRRSHSGELPSWESYKLTMANQKEHKC